MTSLRSLADRAAMRRELRAMIRAIEERPAAPRPVVTVEDAPPAPSLEWRETAEGRVGYREARYASTEYVGHQALAPLFEVTPATLHLISRGNHEVSEPGTGAGDLVFFDIETTGLGGAGAAVFLVAAARVEGNELVIRQYVSPSPADEGALLDAVIAELGLADDPVLVSYNGLAFDGPFVDERATLHRRRAGLQSARHLDLLHSARRGYRGVLRAHNLATVESEVLGVGRPELEVAGAEVPAWYFRYVRTGSMRFMAPLLDHNAVDVLSLAAFIAHLHEGVTSGDGHPVRSLALGRLAMAARSYEQAEQHLCIAAAGVTRALAREDAVRDLALARRRLGRRDLAVPDLQWLVEHSRQYAPWARQQLAIYYEHHARDLGSALAVTETALSVHTQESEAWAKRQGRLVRRMARASA
jgi:uncharacterized protein